MGLDPELFVGPVSEHLLCPICQDVLENPVETPCQHLFCENELLEFYAKAGRCTCPVDNMPLDPKLIKKPGRIVLSLLGELVRYCVHKKAGCTWTGQQSALTSHLSTCCYNNRDLLAQREEEIARLEGLLKEKEKIIDAVHDKLAICKQENRYLSERVRALEEALDPAFLKQLANGRSTSPRASSSGQSESGDSDHGLTELSGEGDEDGGDRSSEGTNEEGMEAQDKVDGAKAYEASEKTSYDGEERAFCKSVKTEQETHEPLTDLQRIARLRKSLERVRNSTKTDVTL